MVGKWKRIKQHTLPYRWRCVPSWVVGWANLEVHEHLWQALISWIDKRWIWTYKHHRCYVIECMPVQTGIPHVVSVVDRTFENLEVLVFKDDNKKWAWIKTVPSTWDLPWLNHVSSSPFEQTFSKPPVQLFANLKPSDCGYIGEGKVSLLKPCSVKFDLLVFNISSH